ncbi:MAG: hypothetical protein SF051_05140 [Elusimicrobiota bacterium]|nr:hypothetical protein [Elusimicrobiota bacterium]
MKNALLVVSLLAAAVPAAAWDRLDGQYSGVRSFHTEAVTDEASWRALWARHAPGQPVPEVRFDSEQVAAVFLGQTQSAGVRVEAEVTADPLDPSRVVVFYRPVRPSRPGFAATVMASPFVFVKTRRASETVFEADAVMSVPAPGGRAPSNPVDERRMRTMLDGLADPSFD